MELSMIKDRISLYNRSSKIFDIHFLEMMIEKQDKAIGINQDEILLRVIQQEW